MDATFSRAPSHLYPAPHPSSTQANQAQLCLLLRTLRQQVIAYRTNPDICRSEGALQFGSASPSNFLSYPTNPITATTPSPTLHHHLITRLSLNRICPLLCLCSDISLLQCSSHCFYPQPQFNTVTSAKLPFSAFPSSPFPGCTHAGGDLAEEWPALAQKKRDHYQGWLHPASDSCSQSLGQRSLHCCAEGLSGEGVHLQCPCQGGR